MGGALSVVSLDETKVPDAAGGQRVQFVVKVRKNTPEAVDVEKDLAWAIHFFDSVNGRRIARSVAAPPQLTPVSAPVDWADGVEAFSFEYWQPEMTPQELVTYGRCRYYGCTLELSWKENIQDVASTTPELREIARELPVPEEAPPEDLLRGPSLPMDAPDASLFPANILRPSAGR